MSVPQRLAAIQHLQWSLRQIVAGTVVEPTQYAYVYTVKAASVVLDAVALDTISPTELPYFCFAGPESTREFQDNYGLTEVLRVTLFARVDATGTDPDRKLTAHENLLADIEHALTQDVSRGGIAMDTQLEAPPAPAMGLANSNIVILEQPVRIVLMPRRYGLVP